MGYAQHGNRADTGVGPLLFQRRDADVGRLALRQLSLAHDIPTVHDWVSRPYARYWGMTDDSPEQVVANYREIIQPPRSNAYLGLREGEPAFLMEWYLPAFDRIGEYYPVQPGDHGMHILVAPPRRRIRGFTWAVFRTVMAFMFEDPEVRRVVVEPDVRNDRIHALNRRAGFVYAHTVELPEKTAWLAFCTRADFAAAVEKE